MCLWGTRNAKKVWVDDRECGSTEKPVDDEKGTSFQGVFAAWYYDGEKMHDPLIVDAGNGRVEGNEEEGKVTLVGTNGNYIFRGKESGNFFSVKFKNENGVDVYISSSPYDEHLSSIIPTGKKYVGKLAYQMYKVKRANCSGKMNIGDGEEEVKGSCYFQNVRINSPTSPWYWAFLHSENGYYLDYFVPHFGLPMLRRRYEHGSWLDHGWKKLSRGLHVYDPTDGQLHKIKKFKVERRYVDDLPVFRLHGKEEGKELDLELTAYSRACWRIKQPLLGISSTILHYNEYPCWVTKFEFKDGDKRIDLDDIGHTVGNCEHAWGIV